MDLIVYFTRDTSLYDLHNANKRYEDVTDYKETDDHLKIYREERRPVRLPLSAVLKTKEDK